MQQCVLHAVHSSPLAGERRRSVSTVGPPFGLGLCTHPSCVTMHVAAQFLYLYMLCTHTNLQTIHLGISEPSGTYLYQAIYTPVFARCYELDSVYSSTSPECLGMKNRSTNLAWTGLPSYSYIQLGMYIIKVRCIMGRDLFSRETNMELINQNRKLPKLHSLVTSPSSWTPWKGALNDNQGPWVSSHAHWQSGHGISLWSALLLCSKWN